jgi:hypothetical protein
LGGLTAKARGKGRGIFRIKVNCTNTRFLGGLSINSQGLDCERPPIIVILRPPKDLAVLPLYKLNIHEIIGKSYTKIKIKNEKIMIPHKHPQRFNDASPP